MAAPAGQTPGPEPLRVEVWIRESALFVGHNLGLWPPTRSEAVAMLEALRDHFGALCAQSEALSEFARDHVVTYHLFVWSGQMDFPVADWVPPSEVVFHVALQG